MSVARNVVFNPTLVPGGGAVEMAISVGLHTRARAVTGVEAGPFRAVADALEVIPRTLVQNAGGNAIRALTALRVRVFFFLFLFYFPSRSFSFRFT
jgi:T-complex protein 1 subunit gamma